MSPLTDKFRDVVKLRPTLDELSSALVSMSLTAGGVSNAAFLKAIHVVAPAGTSVFNSLSSVASGLQTQGLIAAAVAAPALLMVAAIQHHFSDGQQAHKGFKKLAISLGVLFLIVPNFAA